MPVRLLIPYVAHLPRLQATASIRASQEIAVGVGIDPAARSGILRAWRRAVDGGQAETALRHDPAKLAAVARAAGIGFRRVPAPGSATRVARQAGHVGKAAGGPARAVASGSPAGRRHAPSSGARRRPE